MNNHEIIEMSTLRGDEDNLTNSNLSPKKQSWSRRQLQKMSSMFDLKSSREDLPRLTFRKSEIQRFKSRCQQEPEGRESPDLMECLKITNPSVISKMNLAALRNVRYLIIEDSEGNLTELPSSLAHFYPTLANFKLTWSQVKTLPQSLLHPGLKILDLEENGIQSVDRVESARSLERLVLRSNQLQTLPENVGFLGCLKVLDLSKNRLKGLPDSIGSIHTLEHLDVSQNKIGTLPESVGNLKKLKYFNVTNNLLTDFPSTFSQLSSLEDLQASSNQLTSLSFSFEALVSLKSLLLSRNGFRNLPACLCSLPHLENLSMSGNELQFFSDPLVSVNMLNVDSNLFTEIPKSIIDSPNLEHLWMRANRLTAVPEDVSRMRSLRSLDLSRNRQLQSLPSSMVGMPALRHLSLKSTLVETSDEVAREVSRTAVVHLDDGVLGGSGSPERDGNQNRVTPEMLKLSRFCAFHSSGSCGCAGKLSLVSDSPIQRTEQNGDSSREP